MGGSGDLLAHTLIGRDGALRAIDDLLEAAPDGRRVLCLIGDAGLGKTRLATHTALRARAAGLAVLEGRTDTIDARLPLGAYRNAIRDARRRNVLPDPEAIGDELAQLFPRWLLPELGEPSPTDLDVVFESAIRFVRTLAADRGALIVLEDLHLAAPSTCSLTLHLAASLRGENVALLLTYRDGETTRPLDTLRGGLVRARLGVEMRLEPLTQDEVGEMLGEILGVQLSPAAVREIATTAAGNPFAVEETLRECVDSGWLDRTTGAWSAPTPVPLPWTVREVITARVHELDPSDREILRWVAVLGDRADYDVLLAVSGLGEVAARAGIGRLCAVGLLTDGGPGTPGVAFRHALGRDAVLTEMLAVDRAARHATVIAVLEARWGGSVLEPTEELLNHALGAGDRDRGFRYSMRAAVRAEVLGAHAEAEAHVTGALRLWTKDAGDAMRAEALVLRGRLLSNLGAKADAVAVLEEARALALNVGRFDLAALALAVSADARWELNRRPGVLSDLLHASTEATDVVPATVRAELTALLARGLLHSGDPVFAARTARDGLALLNARQDPVRLGLRITLGASLIETGELAAGRAELMGVVEDAAELGDPLPRLRALLALAGASLERPDERIRHAQAAVDLANLQGLTRYEGRALWILAAGHLAAGDWAAVEREADAAEAVLGRAESDPVAAMGIRVVRAARERRQGRVAEAMELFQAVIDEAQTNDIWEHELEARVGLARSQLAVGDPEAATATLAPVITRWREAVRGPASAVARLLITAVEVACVSGDADQATALARSVAAWGPGPRAAYVALLADVASGRQPAPGAIAEAAGAIEGLGRRPEAARMYLIGAEALMGFPAAANEACALVERALCLYRAMGSDALSARSEGLLRRLGHAAAGSEGDPRLTAREKEVLALIVEGLSNRAIAKRLVISESTAARHVFNIFSKLGVHTRAQAVVCALGGVVRRDT